MDMIQGQSLNTDQRILLTPAMRQSLDILQMALPELREYIQNQVLSNPLLDLEESTAEPLQMHLSPSRNITEGPVYASYQGDNLSSLRPGWGDGDHDLQNRGYALHESESFTQQLIDQLIGMEYLDKQMFHMCKYIILCLDDRGYLDFDLKELAEEQQISQFKLEQALFIVQSLQPAGVGARTLSECLMLQLRQSAEVNAVTVHAAQVGLQLIADNNISGLAKRLCCTYAEAKRASDVIRNLNPIPSRGYGNARPVNYQIPEASIWIESGQLILEFNRHFMPRLSYNRQTADLLRQSEDTESREYLRENSQSAYQLIKCVENRQATIELLLGTILHRQEGFFVHGEPLSPMTMQGLAKELSLNPSTVSRAVHDKMILFQGRVFPLRDLFSARFVAPQGDVFSSDTVKQQISRLIRSEDPQKPLSDEKIRLALEALQISVSRRTIAKYREELSIPGSSQRRRS